MYVASPPDHGQTWRDIEPGRFIEAMKLASTEARAADEYAHWDKLRHLRPPGDLTSEEWWLTIKMGREAQQTPLLLSDAEGHRFAYSTPSAVQRLLHYVDQHCAGEIAMPEVVTTSDQARHHYLVNSLMEEAIRSSQLEGATTTRRIAKELLRTGRSPRDRSERMILNNYRALEFMRDEAGEQLTAELVITLQRILTEGTLDDPTAAGRLQRPDEERVVVLDVNTGETLHRPPPADQLPARLDLMCSFANSANDDSKAFMHPVVRAILLHFWLAYDHPFEDGNGRTARALFYWDMRRSGYWLTEYLSISRILHEAPSQYAKAFLFTETDGGDTTYFIMHQLKVIRQAIDELRRYLERKTDEVRHVEKLMQESAELNHRQLALLSDAIRHPHDVYTYESHATTHRVTHETARADLLQLVDRGALQRRKVGRKYVFSPVPNLPVVLRRATAVDSSLDARVPTPGEAGGA